MIKPILLFPEVGRRWSLWMMALFMMTGTCLWNPSTAGAQENRRSPVTAILKGQFQQMETGQLQISVTPCYKKYKGETAESYYTGLLLRAYPVENWEFVVGSDFLSYQRPDFGVSDIYAGVQWTFYDRHSLTLAVSGYLSFPAGSPAFRNPGIQPTLALTISQAAGAFEFTGSAGTTYAADAQGEPCYFDFEASLEIDYTLDQKNAFGVYSYGYIPDQREEGAGRLTAGASYTRTFNERHSASVILEKGLSGRGLDWSLMVSYDFMF
ncbi:MAG: hypothetical protein K4571_07935 [Deltaproteobacteria bacterium]